MYSLNNHKNLNSHYPNNQDYKVEQPTIQLNVQDILLIE